MPRIQVLVPYSAVFDEPWDFSVFRSFVQMLSRTDAIIWCARLNLVLGNPSVPHIAAQEAAIIRFFDNSEIEKIQTFTKQSGGARNVAVFSRAQLLEVIRWLSLLGADRLGDGTTFRDPAVRRVFARVALIAGEIWLRRVFQKGLSTSGDVVADRVAAMPFARQSIALSAPALNTNVALARSRGIYDAAFGSAFPDGIRTFEGTTRLRLDEYLACVYGFASDLPNYTPENMNFKTGLFNTNDLGPDVSEEGRAVVARYLTAEAQTPDQLGRSLRRGLALDRLDGSEPFDYKPLRQRPVLRLDDGRAIVLDPGFYTERAVTGPLFIVAERLAGRGAANTVFGAFGMGFEEYVKLLLSRAYPPSPAKVFTGSPQALRIADGATIELADGLLDQGREVVLFEAKAAFIPDGISDEAVYKDALRKKYGIAERVAGDRPIKGVGQLARATVGLATGALVSAEVTAASLDVAYPVLVVHDATLSAPGHADFFAAEFEAAVAPEHRHRSGYMRKGTLTIAPLILMTIDDLEALQSSVEKFRLLDLLRDYCNSGTSAGRGCLKEFMAAADKYKFIHSRVTGELSIEAIQASSRILFGRSLAVPDR